MKFTVSCQFMMLTAAYSFVVTKLRISAKLSVKNLKRHNNSKLLKVRKLTAGQTLNL